MLIPKLLQLLGVLGWGWEGIKIYKDRQWRYRIVNLYRATIIWSIGILLEILVNKITT